MKTSITDGQKKQYRRFVEDATEKGANIALKKVPLDKDGLQKLFGRGDEFHAAIAEVIVAKTRELSISNRYANEEVSSNSTYPEKYKGPKPISEQVDALAKIFGLSLGLTSEYIEKVLPTLTLPDGAEGWFAIPSVDALASRFFPEVKDSAERYCRAVNLVLQKIGDSRSFYNYREGEITSDRLRVHARTAHALDIIAKTQKGDILIVAAQLGMHHRGRSVRRAREIFTVNEFGLGSVAVGSIVLTHPERLVRWEELDMDCAGDEFAPDADGIFSFAPVFYFNDDRVRFAASGFGHAHGHYGSVSAFLPQ